MLCLRFTHRQHISSFIIICLFGCLERCGGCACYFLYCLCCGFLTYFYACSFMCWDLGGFSTRGEVSFVKQCIFSGLTSRLWLVFPRERFILVLPVMHLRSSICHIRYVGPILIFQRVGIVCPSFCLAGGGNLVILQLGLTS